jgi:hypothetical protein
MSEIWGEPFQGRYKGRLQGIGWVLKITDINVIREYLSH